MTTATSVFVTEPGNGSVLAVQTHDLPAPAPGEVQIEVAAAGVNFIDVYKRQGIYPVPTPFVLGEEGSSAPSTSSTTPTSTTSRRQFGRSRLRGSTSSMTASGSRPSTPRWPRCDRAA